MKKTKNEVKEKKTYDVEASMKSAVNLMFTQIQATQGSIYLESVRWLT